MAGAIEGGAAPLTREGGGPVAGRAAQPNPFQEFLQGALRAREEASQFRADLKQKLFSAILGPGSADLVPPGASKPQVPEPVTAPLPAEATPTVQKRKSEPPAAFQAAIEAFLKSKDPEDLKGIPQGSLAVLMTLMGKK